LRPVDTIITDIRSRMKIGHDVDIDSYADAEEAAYIRPVAEYRDRVWEHRQRLPHERGGLLPWSKTHNDVQIPRGCLVLWAGKRGQGKSLLANHVMLHLISRGERIVMAPTEMRIEETLERLENQALGVDDPTYEYQERFYTWADGHLWFYDEPEGVSEARRMIGLCRYSINEIGATHVLIDSLMMINFRSKSSFDKNEAQIKFARALAGVAKSTGATIHLVAHFRKDQGGKADADQIKGAGELTDLATNVFFVSANTKKQDEANKPEHEQRTSIMEEPDIWLKVEKQRHGPSGGNFALWLHRSSLQLLSARTAPVRRLVDESYGLSSGPKGNSSSESYWTETETGSE